MAHMPHIAHCTWKNTFDDKVCVVPPSAGLASCHQAVRINACQHRFGSNSMLMDDVSRCLKWQMDTLSISLNVLFHDPHRSKGCRGKTHKNKKHHMLQCVGGAEHSWTVVSNFFLYQMPFCTRIHMKCAGVCTVWTTPVQIILSRMIKTLLMMKILLVSSLAKVEKFTERDSVVSLWKALIGPPDSWWYKYLQWSASTFKILYLYIVALAIGKALLSLDITHLKNVCILSIWLLDCCYYIVTVSLWLCAFHWQCLLKPCAFASMLEACRAEMNGELPCQAFFFRICPLVSFLHKLY